MTSYINNTLCHKNGLCELLQVSYTRGGGQKKDSPYFYETPTRLGMAKTDGSNYYKPPTRFVMVKMDSPNFYKSDYTRCGSQNGLSKL